MSWRLGVLAAIALLPLAAQPGDPPPEAAAQVLDRGTAIATAVGTVTSTAISPLAGVCALGIWEYWKTPADRRAALPFWALPVFWIPISFLLILIFLKDSIGSAAPLLKKPLDAAEVLLVNKAAIILVAFPVVLHEVARAFGRNSIGELFAALDSVVYAASAPAPAGAGDQALALLLAAAGTASAFVVWMMWHAFDVLVLLSPLPLVDLALKLIRVAAFAALAALTWWSPWLSLAVSAVVILASVLLAGWACRLLVFGTVVSWDLLGVMALGLREVPQPGGALRAFTDRRIHGLPKRTCGTLSRAADGRLEFRYRTLGLAPRTLTLDDAAAYEAGRALLMPAILKRDEDKPRILFRLAPRYARSEEQLRETLGLAAVRDIRWGSGFREFWRWMVSEEDDAAASAS
jgi:hypothetical protein